jgi:hypothetical protein
MHTSAFLKVRDFLSSSLLQHLAQGFAYNRRSVIFLIIKWEARYHLDHTVLKLIYVSEWKHVTFFFQCSSPGLTWLAPPVFYDSCVHDNSYQWVQCSEWDSHHPKIMLNSWFASEVKNFQPRNSADLTDQPWSYIWLSPNMVSNSTIFLHRGVQLTTEIISTEITGYLWFNSQIRNMNLYNLTMYIFFYNHSSIRFQKTDTGSHQNTYILCYLWRITDINFILILFKMLIIFKMIERLYYS